MLSPVPTSSPSSSSLGRATLRPASSADMISVVSSAEPSPEGSPQLSSTSSIGLSTTELATQSMRTRNSPDARESQTPAFVAGNSSGLPSVIASATVGLRSASTASSAQYASISCSVTSTAPGTGTRLSDMSQSVPTPSTAATSASVRHSPAPADGTLLPSSSSERHSVMGTVSTATNASFRAAVPGEVFALPSALPGDLNTVPTSAEQVTMTMSPSPSPVENVSVSSNATLITVPPCAGPCRLCLARTEVAIQAEATLQCPMPDPAQPCMHWLIMRAGLGNRMRAMVSYLAAARYMGCHLTVLWYGAREGNSSVLFGDLFELPAAPDLHVASCIVDSGGCDAIAPGVQGMPDDAPNTYHIHPQTHRIFPLLGPLVLQIFRPLPRILARVEELLTMLGPSFTALHIRRTDKNGGYVHDAAYAAWTKSFPDEKVFAAVDNALSLSNVKGALDPGRVVAQENFVKVITRAAKYKQGTSERHTTLADAIVDMWTASFAAHFHGTRASSFSVLIQLMRTARNPIGALGVDAWDDNCADTDDYPRLSPPPPWITDPAAWPTALSFSTVTQAFKLDGEKCRKYAKKKIKQPPQ